MAHFKCGSQQIIFENNNCFDCLNYRSVDNKIPLCQCKDDDGEGGFGCLLMDMHLLYQDKMPKKWLNKLITKDFECPMRLRASDIELSLNDYFKRVQLQNDQLKEGMVQLDFQSAKGIDILENLCINCYAYKKTSDNLYENLKQVYYEQ